MLDRLSLRTSAALIAAGGLAVAVTTALEVVTAPYGEAVSAYPLNGVVHLVKVAALLAWALGMIVVVVQVRPRLGRIGAAAAAVLVAATLAAAVPYSLVEASLDPSLDPSVADARLNAWYDRNPWVGGLASVALPLILLGTITFAVVVLRRRVLPAWAPAASLAAIPVAIAAGVVGEVTGLPLPHPPAWLFLGLACYGLALRRVTVAPDRESRSPVTAAPTPR
jgi:hypothetical protein